MTEVLNMPSESLDRRRERQSERKEKSEEEEDDLPPPPPPPPPPQPTSSTPTSPPPPPRRRDRDSRERDRDRDSREIDIDRPPLARGGSRDYHDRGNRSPPPPPRERDRLREYKRRLSPSPPPYRDRRHSPPPFKRSRRDDGYDGRRRSPRGGYGPDDRRFGYDNAGGYERGGLGGRSGYAEERPHGRYMNRSSGGYNSGAPDWDSGRAAYNDAANATGSLQREGLMSYKQFIQELEDDILPAEAERRYQEYRSEYISTQKRAYFDTHKDEEWLKDKYHPTNLLTVIERRNEHARKTAKDFLLDLQSGLLDLSPGVTAASSGKSGQASEPNSEDEADGGSKRRRYGRGPAKENDISAAPKAHPISSEPRRIQVDIELAQALVCKLDKEKGIEDNILCNMDHDKINNEKSHGGSMSQIVIIRGLTIVKGLEGTELLDTLITYLWRIHGVDYYGMIETNEAKGLRHVRGERKNNDEINAAGTDWEKKLDSFWQGRLQGQDPLEIMTSKEKIEAAAAEVLDPHVRKIRDEKYGWKYGCGAKGCTKLFHASEFVQKHLKLKHPELVMELTSKLREDLYFQNYMNDPDAPGGTPIMQQPLQKEKPMRRRPISENRLRDERGNRRVHERIDRVDGDDRYDRTDKSPSRDFPSKTDDPEGRKIDDPMYDGYGGQGMHAAPAFSSDMPPPPPLLMPVPGAGPLGPFVPAPPDVAMRMMREQGGPPFEGNGRNGRNGPQSSGPGPMLGVSPAFRQDPRRIRSYQDLDAPEDEVTVIDYRSL